MHFDLRDVIDMLGLLSDVGGTDTTLSVWKQNIDMCQHNSWQSEI